MAALAEIPSYDHFMWPVIERMKVHGRSMTNAEMDDDVAGYMGLSDDQRSVEHGNTGRSVVEYRMAWARTYLKKIGALTNSGRAVWTLTPKGAAMTKDEVDAGPREVRGQYAEKRATRPKEPTTATTSELVAAEFEEAEGWKDKLLSQLLQLEPAAFERLCQRLLRESDFSRVEVTGRSGDGGIDGTGVLRINLLSFHVLFQCKRYTGSVGAPAVRDFRGAMVGRTDKGLIITTGTFTADARREATRDGAPAIDLVDGDALCDLLKDRGLGVIVRMVEEITVMENAFADF
ncbi:restriction endonuclease [soil metagenome]